MVAKIREWASERVPLGMSLVDFIQEDVPDYLNKFWYAMGATPLILFLILAVTGVLMTFYYVPTPEGAYASVRNITYGVYLGWFIRGVHKISVNLMIFTLLLHIVRVFITRGYRSPGELKWLIGAMIFITTLALAFTGYSLPYDQVSYWGSVVVTNMMGQLPVIGNSLVLLLRGGEEVSGVTLLRLYDLHTKLLPLLIVGLIAAHILVIRIVGFAKVEGSSGVHPFFPDHAMKTTAIAIGLLIIIVNLVAIFPPAIGQPANPQEVASNVAPPWYFSAIYKWITIVPREAGLFGVMLFFLAFIIYPLLDTFFSDRGIKMGRVNIVVGTGAVAGFAGLTLWQVLG
jgi:quinol-cytochrome oxidoreductase complex cytochrome b subunit